MTMRMPTVDWWLAWKHHRTHKDEPLNFDNHPWQPAILKDNAREKVIKKSVKCGVSELMVVSAMARMDQGHSIFWMFPDGILRNRFVQERIDPVLQLVPYYAQLVDHARGRVRGGREPADAVGLKQIGNAAIAFVVSNSPAGMREFVADVVFIDEYDECNQTQAIKAKDRFGHSDVRAMLRVANPTIAGFGIDELYSDSDQKEWTIKCPGCGERQAPNWFDNVVEQIESDIYRARRPDYAMACIKCNHKLPRYGPGEWVARYPDRPISGYHISQLFSGMITMPEIFEHFQKGLTNLSERQRFYNSALGLAYEDEGAKLYDALLDRIVGKRGQVETATECIIGVDPGLDLHCISIDKQDNINWIGWLRGSNAVQELENKMYALGALVIIEGDYDPRTWNEFAKKHRGRVFLCTYRTAKSVDEYIVDRDNALIKANRTWTMDSSHAAIISGEVTLPRDAKSIPDFYKQMCAPTRIEEKQDTQLGGPKSVFRWICGGKPDHWRHAFNFAWIGRNLRLSWGNHFLFTLKKRKRR